MQATLGLIEKSITRGWLNMAQLAEIRDTMIGEATYDLDTIEGKVNTLELKTAALQQSLDDAYSQRNALAVALAKVTLLHGGSAGRGYDDTPEKDWDPEWRNVVYVDVPGVGQVSWHMGPKDLPRIESLPQYKGTWDGTAYGRDVSWPDNIDTQKPRFVGMHPALGAPYTAPQPQAEPTYDDGFRSGRAESEFLAAAIKNPACPSCGATCSKDAETKCRPSGDGCPGTDWPLANLWALQEAAPQPQVSAEDVRLVDKAVMWWGGGDKPACEELDAAWQRLRASLGVGRE